MEKDKRKNTAENNAQNAKQNQDFPNLPQTPRLEGASKIEEKQVKKTSKLHKDGRTDNTEQNKTEE
ncbi:hypothetical protein SDC9_01626 [bioreactor metagenome]|uniref:Uncharacterized protein n=1 Tax=bioreactor metagenome TaxID=1076179 RepID=A0A644SN98_9ZZZZ|nr:hypothetical protein [Cloacibacterium sp. TD35]MBV2223404.1 hypothetical protein [Cloacibacterium sp.]WDT67599.1 hypothetical protein N7277_09695 [Cloacibacterium sp. TD35]